MLGVTNTTLLVALDSRLRGNDRSGSGIASGDCINL